MTLFDDGENPIVPGRVWPPGRRTAADCDVSVTALGYDEVVVSADVRGDEVLRLFVDGAATFMTRIKRALAAACEYAPPECRLVPEPGCEDVLPVLVGLSGSKGPMAGGLSVRADGKDAVGLDSKLGDKGSVRLTIEEAANFLDLLEHALEEYEPDTEGGE